MTNEGYRRGPGGVKRILRREIAKPSLSAYSCRSDTRTMPVRGNTMQDS